MLGFPLVVVAPLVFLVQVCAERDKERLARAEAEREKTRASDAAATAEESLGFILGLLRASRPGEGRGKGYTVRQFLDEAAAHLRQGWITRPAVRAALLDAIGNSYLGLGEYDDAIVLFDESRALREAHLQDDPAGLAKTLADLASTKFQKGDAKGAEKLLALARELQDRTLPPDHPARAAVAIATGTMFARLRRLEEAELHIQAGLDLRPPGSEHRHLAVSAMGELRFYQGRYDDAERCFREVLDECRRTLPSPHRDTARAMIGLARVLALKSGLRDDSKEGTILAEVEALFNDALEIQRAVFEPNHVALLDSLNFLILILKKKGDMDGAVRFAHEALDIVRNRGDDEHPRAGPVHLILGKLLLATERFDDSATLRTLAADIFGKAYGPRAPLRQDALLDLAELYDKTGRPEKVSECRAESQAATSWWEPRAFGGKRKDQGLGVRFRTRDRLQHHESGIHLDREWRCRRCPRSLGGGDRRRERRRPGGRRRRRAL